MRMSPSYRWPSSVIAATNGAFVTASSCNIDALICMRSRQAECNQWVVQKQVQGLKQDYKSNRLSIEWQHSLTNWARQPYMHTICPTTPEPLGVDMNGIQVHSAQSVQGMAYNIGKVESCLRGESCSPPPDSQRHVCHCKSHHLLLAPHT